MVLDLMYVPAETQLLRDAKAAGAAETMNGDTMLVHQTAAAFELWTGRDIGRDFVQKRLDEVRADQTSEPIAAGADS
jgi:shikimate dehydrogenase